MKSKHTWYSQPLESQPLFAFSALSRGFKTPYITHPHFEAIYTCLNDFYAD